MINNYFLLFDDLKLNNSLASAVTDFSEDFSFRKNTFSFLFVLY